MTDLSLDEVGGGLEGGLGLGLGLGLGGVKTRQAASEDAGSAWILQTSGYQRKPEYSINISN